MNEIRMKFKFWIWIAVVVCVIPLVSQDTLAACHNKRRIIPRQSVECGRTYAKYHHHHHVGHSHNHTHRIAGGYNAKPGEFPSFVSIKSFGSRGQACGGTLITRYSVLTAAHCVEGRDKSQFLIVPGISGFTFWEVDQVETYRVQSICVSPKYDYRSGRPTFDFAVILLDRPVTLSQTVHPACLPDQPLDTSVQAYAIGTGVVNTQNQLPRTAQVLPVRKIGCPAEEQDNSRICFQANQDQYVGDTCDGDSGGPIIATIDGRQTVYGITSYGEEACQAGNPAVSKDANVWKQRYHIQNFAQTCLAD